MKHWIQAFRLRTLFLSLSGILLGNSIAFHANYFHWPVAIFSLLTALFLQILSNVANDYGDSIHGADHAGRKGPARAVQSGKISKENMKKAMIILAVLSFLCGVLLLYVAYPQINKNGFYAMLIIGILAIASAIAYTNGKKPYGYMGLGDVFVFIFFGIVAVCGTYYLQSGECPLILILPSSTIGLLSAGVLNINNMRDIESDRIAGKNSLALRLGLKNAKIYHTFIIILAIVSLQIFFIYTPQKETIYTVIVPIFIFHIAQIWKRNESEQLDPMLKQLSLSTFILVVLASL